jgi:Ca2+-binding EF-hand superfamily protein
MIAAAGAASQLLSTLLSKLSSSYAPSSSSSTTAALTSAMQQALPGEKTPPKPAPKPQLSDQTLLALVALQSQNGSDAAATGSAASADPVQKLFSAMDTDGDGEVSQSEMEAYIQKQGGSQAQADSLFSAIDQTNSASRGSNGISESQMASAMSQAQQVQQAHGGHHHHHHKSGSANDQADTTASSLLQALDGNDDGSVSEDEFSNVITANGGTAADASSDFAALNTGNSNALTSTDFAKAYNAYQTQQNTQSPGSLVVSVFNQLAGASGGATSISA